MAKKVVIRSADRGRSTRPALVLCMDVCGGLVIMIQGRAGTIVGARGGYLRVRVPGCERILTMHPTWRIFYLAARCVASA